MWLYGLAQVFGIASGDGIELHWAMKRRASHPQ
jgi:hypothetical protein